MCFPFDGVRILGGGGKQASFFSLFCLLDISLSLVLVLYISVRKHSIFRRGNTKTIECLTLTYIFKYSFLIVKLVIDIKVRVSDFSWKTGGSGNIGAKLSAGKHKLEPNARRCPRSVLCPPALGLGFVTLSYS